MASGSTIYITYALIPTGQTNSDGYQQAIHCNYIKKLPSTQINPYITEINVSFSDVTKFRFMGDGTTNPKTGYTVNRIYAIVQIVDNTPFDTLDDVIPDSTAWRILDVTDQVVGYAGVLTPALMTGQVFKVSLYNYNTFSGYTLNYLDYPSSSEIDDLAFGASTYFFGNVSTSIKADVYTTDININLPLNEFNSSTNKTWDSDEDETVYISEVGLYDSNKNLVAIGKLNDPVAKDGTIARTIVFALDF
jgi:hypothetical protein